MLVLFSTTYNQETAIDLKGRWVSSQPVKHRSIISSVARSVGKQYPSLVQLLLKKPQHLQGMQHSFRFLSWLSSRSSEIRNAGWKEFLAIPCYRFFLSKPPIANHSEAFSCTWWGTSHYPAVSLGPGTRDCALNKDLLLPSICWLFCRTMLHYNIKRHLFQQPVWMTHSQAFYRRIGKVWCCEFVLKCLCACSSCVYWAFPVSSPYLSGPVLKPATAGPLCTSPAAGAWEHFQLIRPFSIVALWFSPACLLHFVPYVWANLPFPLQIIPLWTTGISTHIFLYAPQ